MDAQDFPVLARRNGNRLVRPGHREGELHHGVPQLIENGRIGTAADHGRDALDGHRNLVFVVLRAIAGNAERSDDGADRKIPVVEVDDIVPASQQRAQEEAALGMAGMKL